MSDYKEALDKILLTIPFEQIRLATFEALKKDGVLTGENEDINYLIMEQVDHFKFRYEKAIKKMVWEIVFRQIRKTMGHDVKSWYQSKIAEGFCASVAEEYANGVKEAFSVEEKEYAQCVADDLEFDLGGEGA